MGKANNPNKPRLRFTGLTTETGETKLHNKVFFTNEMKNKFSGKRWVMTIEEDTNTALSWKIYYHDTVLHIIWARLLIMGFRIKFSDVSAFVRTEIFSLYDDAPGTRLIQRFDDNGNLISEQRIAASMSEMNSSEVEGFVNLVMEHAQVAWGCNFDI